MDLLNLVNKKLWSGTTGGKWSNFAKGLQWGLNKLLRYLYGRCPDPDICRPEDKANQKPSQKPGDKYEKTPSRDTSEDSVNWEGIDLTHKPLAPEKKEREYPGQKEGVSGPVIVQGEKDRQIVFVFYDPCGAMLGAVKKEEVSQNSQLVKDFLKYAHLRGEHQFFKGADDLISRQDRPRIKDKLEKLDDFVTKKKKDLIEKYGKEKFEPITDWRPEAVVILQQGIPPKDLIKLAEITKDALLRRRSGKYFRRIFEENYKHKRLIIDKRVVCDIFFERG